MAQSKKENFSPEEIRLAEFTKALSHPARVAILKILSDRQSCICGEIVDVLPLAQATVSQHLKELKNIGLVKGEIDGPRSCYCINYEVVAEFQELMQKIFSSMEKPNLNKCC